MITVSFPEPAFRIKNRDGKDLIFDDIRKQWVVLSEEEWVRQNWIQYLIQEMKYPRELIALEKEIDLGERKMRFDILVFNSTHQPWMLIECKAPGIRLDEKVFDQVLRYHLSIPVSFLVITNGNETRGWEKIQADLKELTQLPEWEK